jgi:hypothetical protein
MSRVKDAILNLNDMTGHNFSYKEEIGPVYTYFDYHLMSDGEPLKAEGLQEKDFLLLLEGVAVGILMEMVKFNKKKESNNETETD